MPRVLVVFADAMGLEQLELAGFGSLPHRRALGGVLGYSSGALATLLTGAPPAVHGRMCLFTQRGATRTVLSPLAWLGLLPRVVHERAALRRFAARILARANGLTGYLALHRVPPEAFRWLDVPERDDLFNTPAVGGAPTFLARARAAGLTVYTSPWQVPEPQRWQDAHAALARESPDLAFLYAAELDASLHVEGADGPRSRAARRRIVENVDRAREAMSREGPCVTLVVGDHGMAEVRRFVDPRPLVRRLRGARAFVDSTMLRLWGDPRALSLAREVLSEQPGRFLDTAALRDRRAPVEGEPYGGAAFLLEEGTIFAPSFMGGRIAGMHGYDLDAASARASVASDVPLPEGLRELQDLAPLICERLGIPG